jgi:DNA polymerase III epsilon subunit-like protein
VPVNTLDLVVFDFETGGLNPEYNEAVSVGAKAYNMRTLEPYPVSEGGEFYSLMRPLWPERLEAKALEVNRLTRSELLAAPDQKLVWNQFVAWVGRFNKKGGSFYGAPVAAGKNIVDFDLKFLAQLNLRHCPKGEKTVVFNRRQVVDLEQHLFNWFNHTDDLGDYKMETVRPYFGLPSDEGHNALVDARQTGALLMSFFGLYRKLYPRVKFAGSMARREVAA